MPDWLRDGFTIDSNITAALISLRLSWALLFGCLVAAIYWTANRLRGIGNPKLMPTLILLAVIIAMVTLAIGSSVARAFSLVGALSIVRFRTVVDDSRDTAFVILAVAVGLAAGAGLSLVALIGIPFAAVASMASSLSPASRAAESFSHELCARLGIGHAPASRVGNILASRVGQHVLTGMKSARQGAAYDLTYLFNVEKAAEIEALTLEVAAVEGVQEVEVRSRS